jgi:hypothetical protein
MVVVSDQPATESVPIACSLDGADQAARGTEWADVLAAGTVQRTNDDGLTIGFAADPALAGRLADLAVREQQCCPFFAFSLDVRDGRLALTVMAPPQARDVVSRVFG